MTRMRCDLSGERPLLLALLRNDTPAVTELLIAAGEA